LSEDPDILPDGLRRPKDGLLRREHFTPERIKFYANLFEKIGGMPILSEEQRAASLRIVQSGIEPGEDVWVFGYGSLMWNPAIKVAASEKARIEGFHRKFCLTIGFGRGTPEKPGLMLGLDEGGECVGVAHRIAGAEAPSELEILWQREMLSGAYHPRWLDAEIGGAGPTRVVTFVINRAHPRYEGDLSEDQVAQRLAAAEGVFGSNRDYLYRMTKHLDSLGVTATPMHALERRVRILANEIETGETP
jgi:glutathione-specific gamma-glutamylcyclotransferase